MASVFGGWGPSGRSVAWGRIPEGLGLSPRLSRVPGVGGGSGGGAGRRQRFRQASQSAALSAGRGGGHGSPGARWRGRAT